ncbi:MAG: helix-turn-helix transcriptional regulator [Myxococcota bacterium]
MEHDERPSPAADGASDGGAARAKSGEAGKEPSSTTPQAKAAAPKKKKAPKRKPNNVKKFRIERMMSKAELARRANLSVLTVDRVEKGFGCRMNTKRKILEALGLSLADRVRVFGEEE